MVRAGFDAHRMDLITFEFDSELYAMPFRIDEPAKMQSNQA